MTKHVEACLVEKMCTDQIRACVCSLSQTALAIGLCQPWVCTAGRSWILGDFQGMILANAVGDPIAESFGVSAQIRSGVVRGGPEVEWSGMV